MTLWLPPMAPIHLFLRLVRASHLVTITSNALGPKCCAFRFLFRLSTTPYAASHKTYSRHSPPPKFQPRTATMAPRGLPDQVMDEMLMIREDVPDFGMPDDETSEAPARVRIDLEDELPADFEYEIDERQLLMRSDDESDAELSDDEHAESTGSQSRSEDELDAGPSDTGSSDSDSSDLDLSDAGLSEDEHVGAASPNVEPQNDHLDDSDVEQLSAAGDDPDLDISDDDCWGLPWTEEEERAFDEWFETVGVISDSEADAEDEILFERMAPIQYISDDEEFEETAANVREIEGHRDAAEAEDVLLPAPRPIAPPTPIYREVQTTHRETRSSQDRMAQLFRQRNTMTGPDFTTAARRIFEEQEADGIPLHREVVRTEMVLVGYEDPPRPAAPPPQRPRPRARLPRPASHPHSAPAAPPTRPARRTRASRRTPNRTIAALPRMQFADYAKSKVDFDDQCHICYTEYEASDKLLELACGPHVYHESCIVHWLKQSKTCPKCRAVVKAGG